MEPKAETAADVRESEMKLIIQNSGTKEARDMTHYAVINDIQHVKCSIENIQIDGMPIGSVEFVQEYFHLSGLNQPQFDPYELKEFLNREICVCNMQELLTTSLPIFIKPKKLKQFNGFVFHGLNHDYDAHDKEQVDILAGLPLDTELYASSVINFLAEWRLYITNGELVAACRYDANDEEYEIQSYPVIYQIVDALNGRTVAADVGLTDNGELVLVELNDAWAIGKYTGISNSHYFEFLKSRWSQIIESPTLTNTHLQETTVSD